MNEDRARDGNRRTFLKWATHGLGALFALLLGVPAVAYLIDARNRPAPKRGMRRVARLSDLKVGEPKQFVIRDVRRDAWTLHPNDVVGRVWLVRRDDNSVDAFTTICPHLGCSVDWRPAERKEERGQFVCPCHGGTFDGKGELVRQAGNPAPRSMDRLEVRVVKDDAAAEDGFIDVKYENFYQGRPEKIARS